MTDYIHDVRPSIRNRRIRLMFFTLIALSLIVLISSAVLCDDDPSSGETITIKDIRYSLSDDYKATVISTSGGYSGNVVIPETFNYNVNVYTVTGIGPSAFSYCSDLTSVSMPATVTALDERAFYMCIKLNSVTLPEYLETIGDCAFYGCCNLQTVTLPAYVESIGKDSFTGCTSLQSFNIPQSVVSIESTAFCGCTGLTSFTVSSSNKYYTAVDGVIYNKTCIRVMHYPAGKTDSTYTIAEKVISVEDYAFADARYLTEITISKDLKTIGSKSFCGCTGLASVTIPDGTTDIDENAFERCSNLMDVTFGTGLKTIKYGTFIDCIGLTSVTLPSNITSIGERAFYGCFHLVEICNMSNIDLTIGDTENGYIAYYAENIYSPGSGKSILKSSDMEDYRVYYIEDDESVTVVTLIADVENITLPVFEKRSIIRYGALMNNSNINSITIPENYTEIEYDAFRACTALESVVIGDNVTDIGDNAFFGCSKLISLHIGNSVKTIGDRAFCECERLVDVVFDAKGCTDVGMTVFDGSGLKSTGIELTFTENVKSIPDNIFVNDTDYRLVSIDISDGVETIGENSFADCKKLHYLYIGSTVTSFGKYTFFNCIFYDEDTTTVLEQNCKNLVGFTFTGESSIKLVRSQMFKISFYTEDNKLTETYYKPAGCVINSLDYTIKKEPTEQYYYEQTGWMYSSGVTVTYPFTLNSDVSVKPIYSGTVRWYTITFCDYDETIIKTETKPYGSAVIVPATPQREPSSQQTYTFSGWVNSNGEQVHIPNIVSYDLTVYASYTSAPRMDGTVNVFYVLAAAIGALVLTAFILIIKKPQ